MAGPKYKKGAVITSGNGDTKLVILSEGSLGSGPPGSGEARFGYTVRATLRSFDKVPFTGSKPREVIQELGERWVWEAELDTVLASPSTNAKMEVPA